MSTLSSETTILCIIVDLSSVVARRRPHVLASGIIKEHV